MYVQTPSRGEGTSCIISMIYDQSGRANHLAVAPPGGNHPFPDAGVNASRRSLSVDGQRVYAAYFENGNGYRNDCTSGVATADEPETIYMVTDSTHFNGGCCFDYGNAETNNDDDGKGTMECVYFVECDALRLVRRGRDRSMGDGRPGEWVVGL